MNRILVLKKIDICNSTDYLTLYKSFESKFSVNCPNFGNKLWYQGIISEISVEDNFIEYYDGAMKPEEINENYDLALYPMANIFSIDFFSGLDSVCQLIEKLKIPVYIISCGIQIGNEDEMRTLIDAIGKESKRFISAVYNTGGQFALRGYTTAEFFNILGFKDAAVVGCPSLYQMGRDLMIDKKNVDIDSFKVAINGNIDIMGYYLNQNYNIFYDQDAYFSFLYDPNFSFSDHSRFLSVIKFINSADKGLIIPELISEKRIRLLADMWDWRNSFIDEKISFSVGTRIHGNIIAILAGVPAVVVHNDIRTKEMAEFYDIPTIPSKNFVNKKINLFDFYCDLDYGKFNNNFPKKYDDFESFLKKCGIIHDKMNSNNDYFKRTGSVNPKYLNSDIITDSLFIQKHKRTSLLLKGLMHRFI